MSLLLILIGHRVTATVARRVVDDRSDGQIGESEMDCGRLQTKTGQRRARRLVGFAAGEKASNATGASCSNHAASTTNYQ